MIEKILCGSRIFFSVSPKQVSSYAQGHKITSLVLDAECSGVKLNISP